jgi:hypothetical protein
MQISGVTMGGAANVIRYHVRATLLTFTSGAPTQDWFPTYVVDPQNIVMEKSYELCGITVREILLSSLHLYKSANKARGK